jgi:predicted phosphodiesterase
MEYKTGLKVEGGFVTLPKHGKAVIVGDLHSKVENLEQILKKTGFEKNADKNDLYLVFLGDYADRREEKNLETIERVFNLKNRFKDRVVTLAGNHEHVDKENKINISSFQHYLPSELRKTFGVEKGEEFYNQVKDLYKNLPIAVKAGRVLIVHGGIPHSDIFNNIDDYKKPSEELKLQTVWNEPKEGADGFKPSGRGKGVWVFGKNAVESFLKKHDFDAIISGHTHKNENLWNKTYTLDSSGVHGAAPSYIELDLEGLNKKSAVYANVKKVELSQKKEEPSIEEIDRKLSEEIENQQKIEEKKAVEEKIPEKADFYIKSSIIGKDLTGIEQQMHALNKSDLENGIIIGRFSHHLSKNENYKPVTGEGVEDYFKVGNISREHLHIKFENGLLHFTQIGNESPSTVLIRDGSEITLEKEGNKECLIDPKKFNGLILGKGKHKVRVDFLQEKEESESKPAGEVWNTHKELTKSFWDRFMGRK